MQEHIKTYTSMGIRWIEVGLKGRRGERAFSWQSSGGLPPEATFGIPASGIIQVKKRKSWIEANSSTEPGAP